MPSIAQRLVDKASDIFLRPAAEWFRSARADQTVEVYGPRKSLDVSDLSDSALCVGDETSVGLACAARACAAEDVRFVFEAIDPAALRSVLHDIGLGVPAAVVQKSDDRSALRRAVREAVPAASEFDLVLTGDVATIADVRRDVREWDRRLARTKVKAYWAKGRTGLD